MEIDTRALNTALAKIERGLTKDQVPDFISRLAMRTFQEVIDRSPILTGRYRGSHTLAVGAPDESVEPEGQDHYPKPDMGEAAARADGYGIEETIWLNNSLPYAEPIEFGHSSKAPQGTYRLAVDKVTAWAEPQVIELGDKGGT